VKKKLVMTKKRKASFGMIVGVLIVASSFYAKVGAIEGESADNIASTNEGAQPYAGKSAMKEVAEVLIADISGDNSEMEASQPQSIESQAEKISMQGQESMIVQEGEEGEPQEMLFEEGAAGQPQKEDSSLEDGHSEASHSTKQDKGWFQSLWRGAKNVGEVSQKWAQRVWSHMSQSVGQIWGCMKSRRFAQNDEAQYSETPQEEHSEVA